MSILLKNVPIVGKLGISMMPQLSHADLVNFSYRANWSSWETPELFLISSGFAYSFNGIRAAGRLPLVIIHKLKDRDGEGNLIANNVPIAPGWIRASSEMMREPSDPPLKNISLPDLNLSPELEQLELSLDNAVYGGFRALREMMIVGAISALDALNIDLTRMVRDFVKMGRLDKIHFEEWKTEQNFHSENKDRVLVVRIVRDVIVHRGGFVDQAAFDKLNSIGIILNIGDRPPLNANEAMSFIECCMHYGLERISKTDAFLLTRLRPTT